LGWFQKLADLTRKLVSSRKSCGDNFSSGWV
jgi:hypothetical protein